DLDLAPGHLDGLLGRGPPGGDVLDRVGLVWAAVPGVGALAVLGLALAEIVGVADAVAVAVVGIEGALAGADLDDGALLAGRGRLLRGRRRGAAARGRREEEQEPQVPAGRVHGGDARSI